MEARHYIAPEGGFIVLPITITGGNIRALRALIPPTITATGGTIMPATRAIYCLPLTLIASNIRARSALIILPIIRRDSTR